MNRATDNSRSYFRGLTALLWLTLPVMGGLYAMSWNQLPARLATHFDFANRPNGWMSREGCLIFLLAFGALMLTTASCVLSRVTKPDPSAWALLFLFYVISGTLLWAADAIIAYNTAGTPVNVTPVFATGMGAAVLVAVLALGTRRGAELPSTARFGEETHSSRLFALVLGIPATAFIFLIANIPVPTLRIALGAAVALMFAAAAMAWSGFHYLFSPSGVEIRTLGFRLRSIPAIDIRNYAVDRWSAMGGYGIRGVGNRRAYVWGNRGVKIETTEGQVFLGHGEPEKIVRDLDLIVNHQGREVARRP